MTLRTAFGWTLLFAACLSIPSTFAAPKEELRELRERIETLQRQLMNSEENRADAADELRESESAISETNRRLRELSAEQRQIHAARKKLDGESSALEAAIASEQAALGKLLYHQYLAGQPETLRLLLNRQDPNEIARNFHYLSYVTRARADLLLRLRDNLAEIRRIARETLLKSEELQGLQREESKQKGKLEKQHGARQAVLRQVSGRIARQRKQISSLKHDELRLTRLIQQLARVIPHKKTARSPGPQPPDDHSLFRGLKGHMKLPVAGEITNRFGSPRADSGLSWKGLFVAAHAGQEVHAVAAGRVVYADWLRGFGNLMIIDHGDGYMSLYGNNEALFKQAGEEIQAGEAIAAVGSSGGNPDSGLYFEFRHQGKPFDPQPWVARK